MEHGLLIVYPAGFAEAEFFIQTSNQKNKLDVKSEIGAMNKVAEMGWEIVCSHERGFVIRKKTAEKA